MKPSAEHLAPPDPPVAVSGATAPEPPVRGAALLQDARNMPLFELSGFLSGRRS